MSSAEAPSPDESGTPRTRPELSVTQIVASTLAAVTATIAASYFGVSGTVIGAALASVVTVVGNALYSHSIRRTRERVLNVVPIRPDAFRRPPARMAPATGTLATAADPVLARRPFTWRKAAVAAAGLFLIVAGIVTSIELAAGRPLTKVIHDQSGSGTSLFGGSTKKSSPTPTPTTSAPTTSTPTAHPSTHPGSTGPTSSPPTSTPTSATPTPTPTTTTPTSPTPTAPSTPTFTPTTGQPTP
ncbi:MAG TPA: hypothetical protein VE074_00895 [Jatrophihabitantaceae bacterium]|nr:hypothetical protein [Jatrophihabitantaceae bacterium]